MPFDEKAALETVAVRAIETTGPALEIWTDADRAWASRAAAEIVGEGGAPEAFVAARARLALERIGERFKALPRAVDALRWRPAVGVAVVVAAFVAGVATDRVGGAQRINLLAPPIFALIVWNAAVYLALGVGFVVRYGDAARPGPLRGLVTRLAGGRARRGRSELGGAIARFAGDWSRVSAPLYGARAARILHLGAATFAAGLVAGLYVRGIALEYRASWESTFLAAANVRSLLALTLAPGAAVSGIPVPSTTEVEAIRAPAAENAARWLHLMAATVAVTVIVPRLLLALWAWSLERYRESRLPLPLDEPYFTRLLRGFRGGPLRVQIVPYSYAMPATAMDGLERLVRSVFGANAALTILPPVAYGDEEALAAAGRSESPDNVVALFNATATPEREAHGAFLDRLAAQRATGGTLVALVDESAFRARWGGEPARLEERRASWRAACLDRRTACAFASLVEPDQRDAVAELERAVEAALP